MGLPHVLVRFYTNPDGRAARRTTLTVVALLGAFYLFPPLYGVLGRVYLPELPAGTAADTLVLRLPGAMVPGRLGEVLSAVLAGGAFAAFLSTASGPDHVGGRGDRPGPAAPPARPDDRRRLHRRAGVPARDGAVRDRPVCRVETDRAGRASRRW